MKAKNFERKKVIYFLSEKTKKYSLTRKVKGVEFSSLHREWFVGRYDI